MFQLVRILLALCCFILLQANTVAAQVASTVYDYEEGVLESLSAARVNLEKGLIMVEEASHQIDICCNVTSGVVSVESLVTISTIGVSAASTLDFIGFSEEELTFQPGDTRRCIQLTVIEDDIVEGDESLTVQIQSIVLRIGTPNSAAVTIIDNSRISVGLVSTTYTVMEGAQATVCAEIRHGTIARTVRCTLEALLFNGTASPGPANQDFIPGTRVVEFDPRTPSEEVCASFTATDDNIIFETFAEADEFFVVTLISSDNVDVIREDSIAHVVIEDNDGANVTLARNFLPVTEGDDGDRTSVSVCLVLVGVHDGLQRVLFFNLSTVVLGTISEDDFSPQVTQTIAFPSTSSLNDTSCTQYTILGDDIKEQEETFRVSVTAVSSVDIVSGDSEISITILPDGDVIQDCGPLTSPSNGEVTYSSTLSGSEAIYSCNEGYNMRGEESITCLLSPSTVSGIWSGEPPTCNIIDCGMPSDPGDNGRVSIIMGTTFGDIAVYTCTSECYELMPDVDILTRRCLANRSWSGENPHCQLIDCSPPPDVAGCDLSVVASTGCGSNAVYQPQLGFTLEGNDTVTCTGTGEWRGTADHGFPTCKLSKCPLPDPENGSVEISSLTVGSTANFSCNIGYMLSPPGTNGSVCMPNMEWSPQPPTCEVITCPPLTDPDYGTIIINTTLPQSYLTVVNITCNEGYRLEGSDSRMCLSDGTWSGEETSCVLVECKVFLPENGNATVNGTGLGSVVEYTCDVGYNLTGVSLQECLENDTLSGNEPVTCELIDCGPPPEVDNFTIEVDYSNTTYNSYALYTCQGNCGTNISACQENGEWTGLIMQCYTCPNLEDPENGTVNLSNDSPLPGSVATYTCASGYVIEGTSMRECTCDGWSGRDPTCIVIGVVDLTGGGGNDTVIVVAATVGAIVLLVVLCLCIVLVWYCLVKNSKIKRRRKPNYTNYKGNTGYVLPYTIYANRSSPLEPLASNNRNSDYSGSSDNDPIASLRSSDSGFLADRQRSTLDALPSLRGSEFGTMKNDSKHVSSVRGTHFGMISLDTLSNSSTEVDISMWGKSVEESSLSINPVADKLYNYFDDTSSVLTTSTMPVSEYQRRIQAADSQLTAKTRTSILKKK